MERIIKVAAYATGKVFKSASGMCAKLNRRKNASVNENAQINISINKIVQRGILFFQKKESNLYIGHKDTKNDDFNDAFQSDRLGHKYSHLH